MFLRTEEKIQNINRKRKREAQLSVLARGAGRPAKHPKVKTEAGVITIFIERQIDSYYASEKHFSVKSLKPLRKDLILNILQIIRVFCDS